LAVLAQARTGVGGFDVDQSIEGMHALSTYRDPYLAIGPAGTVFRWPWRLFYPFPALLLTSPVAWLPLAIARVVFLAGSAAWLAYALGRDHWWRLVSLTSASFLFSVTVGSWEPALVAASLTPGACLLYLAKPNIGLALAAGTRDFSARTLRGAAWAAGLLGFCVLIWPAWVGDWRGALATAVHFGAPITHPGGILVLLALLRWRRPEARLLVAMACIPQTMFPQSALPLFLIPGSLAETLALSLLSYVSYATMFYHTTQFTFDAQANRIGTAITLACYLPCTVMVLIRPNLSPETPCVTA
jgi:hypothetical protein